MRSSTPPSRAHGSGDEDEYDLTVFDSPPPGGPSGDVLSSVTCTDDGQSDAGSDYHSRDTDEDDSGGEETSQLVLTDTTGGEPMADDESQVAVAASMNKVKDEEDEDVELVVRPEQQEQRLRNEETRDDDKGGDGMASVTSGDPKTVTVSKKSNKAITSSMPLILPSKRKLEMAAKNNILVQVENHRLAVQSETGAIGRIVVNEDHGVVDLMGVEFWAELIRTPSLVVVEVGKSVATVEAMLDTVLMLRTKRNHFDELTACTTGAVDNTATDASDAEDGMAQDERSDSSSDDAPTSRVSKKPKTTASKKGRGGKKGRGKGKAKAAAKKKTTKTPKGRKQVTLQALVYASGAEAARN